MRKTALLWLLLSPFAFAQPALTRTQTQKLSKLTGPAYDQELTRITKRGQIKRVGELNQQSLDAFCEWFLFAVALVDGQVPAESPPGYTFSAHLQQIVVRAWPRLTPENQQKVLNFPAYWAGLRQDWPKLSAVQKQAQVENWRTALSPLIKANQKQELARACLVDLQTTYRNPQSTPMELQQALQRLETAARRMSADGDPESKAQARRLQNAMLAVQAQQDQKRALLEIESQKAHMTSPSSADYNEVFRQINQARR